MNAIPQKAYHNYERIQLPRVSSTQDRGRVSDMEAYRMQKIAAERRRLAQQDAGNTPRRLNAQQKRAVETRQTSQRRQPAQETQRSRRPIAQERNVQRETQGERSRIRQTGVQNVVGGRKLMPAYEGAYVQEAYPRRNESAYNRTSTRREQAYGNTGRYERSNATRPRQAANYGGYAKPRSYERAPQIENTAYNGVKPIAVEYEGARKKGVISTILLIAFVFVILSGLVLRYASISNVSYTNTQIQAENETLRDELDKVKMENALKEDLNSIQERATQLGMYYPKDEQINYFEADLDTAIADTAQTAVQQEAQQPTEPAQNEAGAFGGIKTFFEDLMKAVGGWFGK